jgi:hypothetical protein
MRRQHTGLLIIRAWIEQDSAEPLRAQLRSTTDVSSGLEAPLNLTSDERVGEAVRLWLAAVRAVPASPDAPQPAE